jgi:hypothetical protein
MTEKLYLLSCASSSQNPTRPVMSSAKDKPKDGTLLKRITNSVILLFPFSCAGLRSSTNQKTKNMQKKQIMLRTSKEVSLVIQYH